MRSLAYLLIFFQIFTLSSYSRSLDLDTIIKKVQIKYENINDFHAEFEQAAEVNALNTVQKAYGEVWFKKPGMMRWNYYKPSKDEIVSDGVNIWYYNELENQVMESSIADLTSDSNSTTLLTGLGNLDKIFDSRFSKASPTDSKGNYLIDLTPKDQEGEEFNKVTILVDRDSYLVNKFFIYDLFGNITTINLKNLKINKKISSSKFKFKKPSGAELIKVPVN
ncbi:MAG: outer membrane lipoprotein chaperone LolA [Candidatus Dadabacteria bacterium]|nr:outer membrane lipoprotein chaperone LolA [Candidatus Dadabacteria bacterium]NIQ14220.1 outer membrane lipoprotein chaperone LolA [Candidatus Dadabacteria bacterium]